MTDAVRAGISVVISTRHRPGSLDRCLASLEAGSVRPAEIVVVDQGGDDASERVVQAHAARGVPVTYRRQPPAGLGASQNLGVRTARFPLVAVIDDDCEADVAWLGTLHRTLATGPIDVVAGRVLPQEPEGARRYPVASRTSLVRRDLDARALPWDLGSGNNFALRREWFERVGGCDERLGPGAPAQGGLDVDLFFRLLRAGARARYEPDAVVRHERQTRGERLRRRPMYGRGTGAFIALRLREGDRRVLRVLGAWVVLRGRLLVRALARGDALGAWEELVMLAATARGLAQGAALSAAGAPRAGPAPAPGGAPAP